MKFSLVAIAAVVGSAQAFKKPSVTMSLCDGSFSGIDSALDPTLTIDGSTDSGDIKFDYGLTTSVKPTADIASLPKTVWGNIFYTKGDDDDMSIDIYAEKDLIKDELSVTGSVHLEDKKNGIVAAASSSGGGKLALDSVTAFSNFDDVGGGKLLVKPKYVPDGDPSVDIEYSNGDTDVKITVSSGADGMEQEGTLSHSFGTTDVTVAYNDDPSVVVEHKHDEIDIKLTATASDQEVTLSKTFGDDTISPTFSRSGDVSIAWERDLGDDNSFTATLVPDDSVDVEWKDDNWTASVHAAMSGVEVEAVSVSAKRDINF